MVFYWSLRDSKSPQVSRTLLSILADLNAGLEDLKIRRRVKTIQSWMVFTRRLISKSSSLCTNPLVTVPSAPIAIGITVTFILHFFFCSLARHLSFFSLSFCFSLYQLKWQSLLFGSFSFFVNYD